MGRYIIRDHGYILIQLAFLKALQSRDERGVLLGTRGRPSRVPQSKVIMQIPRRSLDELKGKRREDTELEKGN